MKQRMLTPYYYIKRRITRPIAIILALVLLTGTLATVTLLTASAAAGITDANPAIKNCVPGDNLITNPSFEAADGYWDSMLGSNLSISGAQARTGSKSLVYSQQNGDAWTNWYSKDIEGLAANTEYTFSCWVKCDGTQSAYFIIDLADSTRLGNPTLSNNGTDWTQIAVSFNTGNNNSLRIYIGEPDGTAYYDDIALFETSKGVVVAPSFKEFNPTIKNCDPANNLFADGGFESGTLAGAGWSADSFASVTADAKRTDSYGLKMDDPKKPGDTDWGGIYIGFTLKPNTDYTVSFWEKDIVAGLYSVGSGLTVWGKSVGGTGSTNVSNNGSGDVFNFDSTAAGWTQLALTFNTGDETAFYCYAYCAGGESYLDDFQLFETSKALSPYPTRVEFNPAIKDCAPGDNLFPNGGFESGTMPGWSTDSFATVTAAAKRTGDYGLQLVDPDSPAVSWAGIAIDINGLKPNTNYTFSYWEKDVVGGPYDLGCGMNFYVGGAIEDADHKLSHDYTAGTDIFNFNSLTAGWTQLAMTFNTGEATTCRVYPYCAGGTTYFDDFQLFETSKAAMTPPSRVEFNPLLKDCAPDDNLFVDGGFESGTLAGWTDVRTFTTVTAEAKRSGDYGLKLDDPSNPAPSWGYLGRTITGLKPNTNYTISYWEKDTSGGQYSLGCGMNFYVGGVIDDDDHKLSHDSVAGTDIFNYNSLAAGWTQLALTFNTGAATSCTIMPYVAGGTTYFDDFQLFETSKGTSALRPPGSTPTGNCDPAKNLMSYGTFENPETYYTQAGSISNDRWFISQFVAGNGPQVSVDAASKMNGGKGLHFKNTNPTNGSLYCIASPVDYKLAPGKYVFSFWVQVKSGSATIEFSSRNADSNDNKMYVSQSLAGAPVNEWKQYRFEFTVTSVATSDDCMRITPDECEFYMDDIQLFKEVDEIYAIVPENTTPTVINNTPFLNTTGTNLISNAGFTSNPTNTGWGSFTGTNLSIANTANVGYGGSGSYLQYTGNAANTANYSRSVAVAKNTNYTFSVWVYGSPGSTDSVKVGLAADASGTLFAKQSALMKDSVMTFPKYNNGWYQIGFSFNSGENETVFIYIENPGAGGTAVIDQFKLFLTSTGVKYNTVTSNPSHITSDNFYYDSRHLRTTWGFLADGYGVNGGILHTRNLVRNADFETIPAANTSWNQPTFVTGGTDNGTDSYVGLTTEEAYPGSGTHSLKFAARHETETLKRIFWVDVSANTTYYFSAMVRAYGMGPDNWGGGDFDFGIIDASNYGYLLIGDLPATMYYTETYINNYTYEHSLNPPAWDSYWKPIGFKFKTTGGGSKKIGICITAKNSTVYLDDMFLCTSGNVSAPQNPPDYGKTVGITGTNVTKSSCADANNLFNGFDFEAPDATWTDRNMYGKTVKIATDTNNVLNKVLSYDGKGQYSFYYNWVDVAPSTNYTFSAYVKGKRAGDMTFGLMDNNFTRKNFVGSEAQQCKPASDGEWHQVSFTFNSGSYSKLAFYIMDGGGSAEFDKVRLFKTADAVVPLANDAPKKVSADARNLITHPGTGISAEGPYYVIFSNTTLDVTTLTSGDTFADISDSLDGIADAFKVFDVKMLTGSIITPSGGTFNGSIPVPTGYNKDRILLYFTDSEGYTSPVDFTVAGNNITFTADRFGVFTVAQRTEEAPPASSSSPPSSTSSKQSSSQPDKAASNTNTSGGNNGNNNDGNSTTGEGAYVVSKNPKIRIRSDAFRVDEDMAIQDFIDGLNFKEGVTFKLFDKDGNEITDFTQNTPLVAEMRLYTGGEQVAVLAQSVGGSDADSSQPSSQAPPEDGETLYYTNYTPLYIVLGIVAVLLLAGGIFLIFFLKKKKKKDEENPS